MPSLWLLVLLAPLLAAGAFAVRPWRTVGSLLAAATAAPALLAALWVSPGVEADYPWLLLGVRMGMDDTAKVFLFFTALVWLIAGVYAVFYLREPRERARFFIFFFLAMAGNFGLILAQDVSSFYAFFSMMSLASYGLVVHDRTPYAFRAGTVYFWLVVLGEAAVFFALLLLAGTANSIYLADFAGVLAESAHRDFIIALLVTGFGIKAGALLLHVWLPLAHPAAPSPASAVLSGAMIKAGLLGWLRFLPLGEVALPGWGVLLMAAGLTAAFYGVLVGLTQAHPKTVLAYSSISQMGMMTIAVGVALAMPDAWPYASAAILIAATHHALAKGTLFLSVGVAALGMKHMAVRALRFVGLLLPALVLAGLPLTSGADAKLALKLAVKAAPEPWGIVVSQGLPIAAVGTMLLMVRFLWLTRAPASSKEPAARSGLVVVWLSGIACVMACPFLLRSNLFAGVTLPALVPTSFPWAGVWPVLAGCVVGGLACTLSWPDRWRIAEGDVLALYLVGLRGARKLCAAMVRSFFTRETVSPAADRPPHPALRRLNACLDPAENRMAAWTVFGALFLICASVFFFALSV